MVYWVVYLLAEVRAPSRACGSRAYHLHTYVKAVMRRRSRLPCCSSSLKPLHLQHRHTAFVACQLLPRCWASIYLLCSILLTWVGLGGVSPEHRSALSEPAPVTPIPIASAWPSSHTLPSPAKPRAPAPSQTCPHSDRLTPLQAVGPSRSSAPSLRRR